MMIDFIEKELPLVLKSTMATAIQALNYLDKSVQFLGPETVLKRGFSITLKNGKIVTNQAQLVVGDEIETVFHQSKAKSVVVDKA